MDAVIEPERLVQISLGQENPRMRMNAAPCSLCFRAKGPSVPIAWAIGPGHSVSRVPKPQSGRPFDENASNCRPVGPSSLINRRLPGPMAMAIGTNGPLGRNGSVSVGFQEFVGLCGLPLFPMTSRESSTSAISDTRTSFRAEPKLSFPVGQANRGGLVFAG